MDLSDIKVTESHEKGARLDLRHPTTDALISAEVNGERKTFHLMLVGKYSKRYVAQSHAITDRRLKAAAGRKKVTITSEQLDMERIETAARCTIGGFVVAGGREVNFTNFDDVYAFYANPDFGWVLDLVTEFIEDDSNFLTS